MKPVIVINAEKNEKKYFESYAACARYIGGVLNKTFENIRYRLKKGRKMIYGYEIIYLNAETGHGNSTE